MSRYMDGNLARPLDRPDVYVGDRMPDVAFPERERVKEANRQRLERDEALRREYLDAGKARARMARRIFAVFLVVTVVACFVAWRSAKIAEMSFYNTGLRRQIGEYEKENRLVYDQLASKTSLQGIEERALKQLGMQKATSDSIVHIGPFEDVIGVAAVSGSAAENSDVIERWVQTR